MIPVYEPWTGEEEALAVAEAVRKGELSGLFGASLEKFEKEFAAYVGCKFGVATSNCTTALQLAVRVGGLQKGEEALVSASTNIATALAVHYADAVVVPVDSEEETWNLNLDLLEGLITDKTRMILPVHHYGHPIDMDRLMEIANRHQLMVIEDCAESHGALCRGKKTGSYGQMSCFSFLANKIITTGEGGMVVTDDENLARRLRYLRSLGFGEPRFFHPEPAFNFRLAGYQAAMGLVQLGKIQEIIRRKRDIATRYHEGLAGLAGIVLPKELDWAFHVYWVYGVLLDAEHAHLREPLRDGLRSRGVDTRTFFCPMNQQPFLRKQPGYRDVLCPVSDRLWTSGFYLPSGPTLTPDQTTRVCREFRETWNSLIT